MKTFTPMKGKILTNKRTRLILCVIGFCLLLTGGIFLYNSWFKSGDDPLAGMSAEEVYAAILAIDTPAPQALWPDPATTTAEQTASWKRSAEEGNAEAAFRLAYCYERGIACEKSEALATQWYQQSARAGYAEAQYALGNYYCSAD